MAFLDDEASIVVNGVPLTPAQSMTVRVAMGSFLFGLGEGLGDDPHGLAMAENYRRLVQEIVELMFRKKP